MKKYDYIIIGITLIIGIFALIFNNSYNKKFYHDLKAYIYVDGELYKTVLLADNIGDIEIKTAYGNNTLSVFHDGVKMVYADCNSQTCVKTHKLTTSGSVIACLPHRILVKLSGKGAEEVDIIAN